jgi:inorganic pyrophosphatase
VNEAFWRGLDELVATSILVIDRPRGSAHPRHPDLVYPLDYGHLEGTRGGDGGGIDVWIGSVEDRALNAIVVTVDTRKRDTEIKLLLGCTAEEADRILAVHSGGNQSAVLVERPTPSWAAARRTARPGRRPRSRR